MTLSAIPAAVNSLLGPLVTEYVRKENKKEKDEYYEMLKRTFFISNFNIVKKESLQYPPLEGIRVPIYRWPLIQLPSEKLSGNNHLTYCDIKIFYTRTEDFGNVVQTL